MFGAQNGKTKKAWLQLSEDLTTLRWGWHRSRIELERLHNAWPVCMRCGLVLARERL